MTISRNDLKYELGLGAVKEITNVRKALGHKDWQLTNVNESDAGEVRKYYELIREKMMSPSEALLAIASARTGTEAEAQNDMIDETVIDHSDHRDGEEETSELVVAVRGATQEAALAMTDVGKVAAASVVDAFFISLGNNVVDELKTRSANTRSNFGQVVESVKNAPLDLRNGSLPGKKTNPPKRITGAWG
ncbi:hypothetical protein [Microcoleus sp. B3-D7]|uniref:hypothetical protein n=1 Tax=Microcoleus sp. B3-D7 TaxID=2818659 RepID=UPI002FCF1CBF